MNIERRITATWWAVAPCFTLGLLLAGLAWPVDAQQPPLDSQRVDRLVRQLNDDRAARREEAEQQLLEMAGTSTARADAFLSMLPTTTGQMPPAVRERLSRIRNQVEQRVAESALAATTVTLQADAMPLTEVMAELEQQTGNRMTDHRPEFGQEDANVPLTFDFQAEPFWSATDQILDQAELSIYNFAGGSALALVAREAGGGSRYGRASYVGPFRFEVVEVQAQRSFRKPRQQALKIGLEIAWEPRLRPIAFSQAMADLEAIGSDGEPIGPSTERPILQIEVPAETQGTDLVVPLELPSRSVTSIATLHGKLTALVPGRQASFHFDKLASISEATQSKGGVSVTVDEVRRNQDIWELHMRLQLDEASPAMESHRGWVFQNASYLVDRDGETIDYAGMETSHQTSSEVGIVYLFDLSGGLDGLSWVYETPAAIVEMPVTYELNDIALP